MPAARMQKDGMNMKMHGTPATWVVILSVALGCQLTAAGAGEVPLNTGASWVEQTPANAEVRKSWIDAVLADRQTPSEVNYGVNPGDLAQVLHDADTRAVNLAACETLDFHANPEPSSLLVWAATAMGVIAAGYGYRRRNQNESVA